MVPEERGPTGSATRRALKNVGFLLGGNGASYLLSLVTVVLVARKLGPAGYGLVSSVTAFVAIFSFTGLGGFDKALIREASREPERTDRLLASTSALKVMVGLGALVVCVVSAFVVPGLSMPERIGIAIASVLLVSNPLQSTLSNICQIHEDMKWLPYIQLVRQTTYIALAATSVLAFGPSPVLVVIALVTSYLLGTALWFRVARRWTRFRIDFRVQSLDRPFMIAGSTFTFITFFSFLFTRVDVLMIRAYGDLAQVGLYAAALALFTRVNNSLSVFSTAFFPTYCRRIEYGELKLEELFRTMGALLAIGASTAGVVTVVAPWCVPLLLGRQFAGAVLPLQILVWAFGLSLPGIPLQLALQAGRQERLLAAIMPARAAMNVGLDWLALALGYGIAGVAAGTIVTTAFYYGVLAVMVWRGSLLGAPRLNAAADGSRP